MRWAIPPDGDNPIQHFRWTAAVGCATVSWLGYAILAVWLIVGGDAPARIIGVVLVIVLVVSARRGLSHRNKRSG
jgi:hypothetical protein